MSDGHETLAAPTVPQVTRDAVTGDVTVTWGAVEGAPGYTVNVSTDGVSWLSGPSVLAATSVKVTGTDRSKPLYVRVRALEGSAPSPAAKAEAVVAPAPTSVQLALSADKSGVVVTGVPAGAVKVHFAFLDSTQKTTRYSGEAGFPADVLVTGAPPSLPLVPPAGYPVVDAIARDANGADLGGWFSSTVGGVRLVTTPAAPPNPAPTPTPAPPSMEFALDTGGWGGIWEKMAGQALRHYRSGSTAHVEEAKAKGVTPASIIFGEGGTVGGINPASYAASVCAAVKAFGLRRVEVLNEPGGSWFWTDPTNYPAYVGLLKAVHDERARLGLSFKIVGSYDGGQGGSVSFGRGWKALGGLAYVDEVSMHPYGGAGSGHGKNTSAEGWVEGVEVAHAESGKPVAVTEVGWPTGPASTGDSKAWSESAQAVNIEAFVKRCRALGYVSLVVVYNLVNEDDSGNAQYGIWKHTLMPKLAAKAATVAALASA